MGVMRLSLVGALLAGGGFALGMCGTMLIGVVAGLVAIAVARRRTAILLCGALSVLPIGFGAFAMQSMRATGREMAETDREVGGIGLSPLAQDYQDLAWIHAAVGGAGSTVLLALALLAALVKRPEARAASTD